MGMVCSSEGCQEVVQHIAVGAQVSAALSLPWILLQVSNLI